jgi:hypothetical protein
MRVVIDGVQRVMQTPPHNRADILVTPTLDDTTRISIIYENDQFCFDIHDLDVNHYGLTRLPHTIPSDADSISFQRILKRISIYEYYLRQVKGVGIRRVASLRDGVAGTRWQLSEERTYKNVPTMYE